MRARKDGTPVLILTARDTTADRVTGLDAGADDYMVKPFAMQELEARVRALLRRRGNKEDYRVQVGSLEFDMGARRVFVNGEEVTLPRKELALLECLIGKSTNPCREMASISIANLKKRADAIVEAIQSPDIRAIDLKSSFGGGSLPEYEFDSFGIKISGDAVSLSGKLRAASVPVISRSIASGVLVDLRTVFPDQDEGLIEAIRSCL